MKRYLWVFLWAVFVLILFLMPPDRLGVERVPLFQGADKLVHTCFFFVFTVLLFDASIRRRAPWGPSWGTLVRVLLWSLVFAVFTEFLQWRIFTYRSAELWDLLANFIGIGLGTFAYLVLYHFRPHH